MEAREIYRVLKENANFKLEWHDKCGEWDGHGSIADFPECENMTYAQYAIDHYPKKCKALESLPWNKVENPRNPSDSEYPTEEGQYIVMLDCDEHAVWVCNFRNRHFSFYDRTHIKWWMPLPDPAQSFI